jgi:hypothetical protein
MTEPAAEASPGEHAPPAADVPPRPEALGVTVEATGNADVDAALGRLADADDLPVHAHIEVYEDVHRGLRDTLTALDDNRS